MQIGTYTRSATIDYVNNFVFRHIWNSLLRVKRQVIRFDNSTLYRLRRWFVREEKYMRVNNLTGKCISKYKATGNRDLEQGSDLIKISFLFCYFLLRNKTFSLLPTTTVFSRLPKNSRRGPCPTPPPNPPHPTSKKSPLQHENGNIWQKCVLKLRFL